MQRFSIIFSGLCCILLCCSLNVMAQPRAGIRVNNRVLNRGETITICAGSSITYFNEATGGNRISWRFNNGSPRSSAVFSPGAINYPTGGTDTTWQVVSDGTTSDSIFVLVRVTTVKPVAAFTHAPDNQCASTPIAFTNTTTGGSNLRYTWTFGDNRPGSTAANPTKVYETNPTGTLTQSFPVKLVATNDGNCSDSITRTVRVIRTPDPSINRGDPNFEFLPDFNGVPTFRKCENIPSYRFLFVNSSQTISQITRYTLRWGDGSPDTSFTSWPAGPANAIAHTYPRGNTTLTVRVEGSDGCAGVRTYNVFVGTTPAGGFASRGNTSICAPNSLTFNINEFANNAPGTQYRVTVNDNTPTQTFQHPPPNEVSHVFERTSCGQTSSNGAVNFNNSYRAVLDVENPCGATSVSVIPIYVSGKPKANFFVSPSANICVNTTVFLSDGNVYGGAITPVGGSNSTCNGQGKLVWNIAGTTGYTIVGGATGSVNGRPDDGFFWTSGTGGLNVRFTQPGNYRVRIYAANDLCGVDSIDRIICVRNPPTASFAMDKKTDCIPAKVTISNTSPEGPCGGETYQWSVRYSDPAACGGTANFTFTDGTNANSRNPVINFASPGRYVVELRVFAAASGCVSAVFTDTFNAAARPVVNLGNITGICAGNSLTPVANVGNCYGPGSLTYEWTFTGGNPATSTSLNPGAISFAAQGTFAVTLNATNGCGTTPATRNLVVGGRPVANAGPDRTVCSGQNTTLGAAGAPGVTYQWTPGTLVSQPGSSNPTFSFRYNGPSADTTLQLVVKASLGPDCETTDTVLVTVRRGPVVTVQPNTATICAGGNQLLTATGADTWLWTPAAGLDATNKDSVLASPGTTTTYTVTGSLSNGCSAQATALVNVLSRPVAEAGADLTVCNNAATITLQGSPSGGSWSGSPAVTPTGRFNAGQAGNGSFKLFYAFSANGCNATDSMVITVQDPPAANAGRDTSVCADGRVLQLNGTPAGGTWQGSGFISADGRFTAATAGIYSLVYSRGSGFCIGTDTVVVRVIDAVSNNTITATQGVCGGVTPAPLTGSNATAGGLPLSYVWQSSPNSLSWTNIPGETAKDLTLPVPAGTIFYRRLANTAVCLAGSPSNVVRIFIHPNALAQVSPAPLVSCPPFNITAGTLNLTPHPDRNGQYRWFANGNAIGTGEVFPGFTLRNGDDSVTITLITTSRFGCVNDTVSTQFKTLSSPNPIFTLSDTVGCGPLRVTLTNTTPQANRYRFIWDYGFGQGSTLTQPGEVVFPPNPNRGDTVYTVRLRATGGCDTLEASQPVRVRARPRTLFTPDKAEGCSPFTVSFNNNSAGSNARFEWDFGDGSPRVPGSTAAIQHTYFTGIRTTYLVRLFSNNDCGTDTADFTLVVNPNRVRLDFAVNGTELNGCAPHTARFINNTTGANLFRWNFGDGSPVLTTDKGFDTIPHVFADTGTYTITLFASNGCSDTTTTETVRVVQGPRVGFTLQPQAICLGDAITLTNNSDDGLVWNWSFGDGTFSTQRQPAKIYTRGGAYEVKLRATRLFPQGFGCTDSAVARVVVSAPAGELSYRGGFYCAGQSVQFSVANTNAGSFIFYPGNGDSVVTATPDLSYTYASAGRYLPRVVLIFNSCRLTLQGQDSIRVDVLRPGFSTAVLQACGSTRVQFTDTSSSFFGLAARNWRFGDGTVSTLANPVKLYTASGQYPVVLQVTSVSGCVDSVRLNLEVQVQQFPQVTITGDTAACLGQPAFFEANTTFTEGLNYTWTIEEGNTTQGSRAQNIWFRQGIFRVQLIGRTAFGCPDTAQRQVRVHPVPLTRAGSDVTICRGQSTTLTATGATRYTWSPRQGLNNPALATPVANPNLTTQYIVTGTNALGCSTADSVLVRVVQPFRLSVSANDSICASVGERAQLFAANAVTYRWSPSAGLSADNIPNPVATPASTTRYRVVGSDADNCFTDTAFVTIGVGYNPTLQLPQGGLLVAGTAVNLQPVVLTGGPFARYTWTPATGLSCTNCPNPVATINNNIEYRLQVQTIYGCTATDTVGFTVRCQPDQVYIPNAFSPDGDGVNDVFMVRGKGVARVKSFRVFNRFGQVVFERSNFNANDPANGWNGRIFNVPASPDVYVYTAEVICTAGAEYTYKGNVTLFR